MSLRTLGEPQAHALAYSLLRPLYFGCVRSGALLQIDELSNEHYGERREATESNEMEGSVAPWLEITNRHAS